MPKKYPFVSVLPSGWIRIEFDDEFAYQLSPKQAKELLALLEMLVK